MDTLDLVLYIVGGAIAVGLTVLGGTVSSTKPWHKKTFVTLGIASFIVYAWIGVRAFRASNAAAAAAKLAKQQSQRDLDDIKGQLSDSEVKRASDTRYLEGKLEVFGQFAPAVMELARASELNTRKQYEQKVLTNKELQDFVARVVKRMRDWEYRELTAEEEEENKQQGESAQLAVAHMHDDLKSPEGQQFQQQMSAIFSEGIAARVRIDRTFEEEFTQNILDDASSARNQLLNKLGVGAEPQLGQLDKNGLLVFQGRLIGAHPVASAANYLEQFAKELSP